MGRPFASEENRQNLVIVSDALWRSRLASDPGVIGRKILLAGKPFTVVA